MFVEDIVSEDKWNEFLSYKLSKDFLTKKEKTQIQEFITNKSFLPVCTQIANGTYTFSIPPVIQSIQWEEMH